jgi:hypothetical protein
MRKSTKELLIEIRALIGDIKHWTRHNQAVDSLGISVSPLDPSAYRWCILGAMRKITEANMGYSKIMRALEKATIELYDDGNRRMFNFVRLNDGWGLDLAKATEDEARPIAHAAIIKVLDHAIANA